MYVLNILGSLLTNNVILENGIIKHFWIIEKRSLFRQKSKIHYYFDGNLGRQLTWSFFSYF